MKHQRDLQLNEDQSFERVDRIACMAAWTVIALFLAAAAAGFTGHGLFARAVAERGEVRADYARVMRQDSPAEVWLRFPGKSMAINRTYLSHIAEERITPQPSAVYPSEDHLRIEFQEAPASVRIAFQPHGPGFITARISAGESALEFRQLVLP